MYERCVGYAWCPGCRVFTGNMVHVPRRKVLVDELAHLPVAQRNQLKHNEEKLIDYLDRRASSSGPPGPVPRNDG